MKIEIGEYVRTDKGTIARAISNRYEYKDDYNQDFDNEILSDWYCDEKIIKHSTDILDLIEVGDYVNGEKVLKINCNLEYIDDDSVTGVDEVDNGLKLQTGYIYFEYEIKSIVTKEQFRSMEYEV